jgi:regulatory protein
MLLSVEDHGCLSLKMEHRITGLSVQKRNPNRVNLELDGEFALGLERITAAWLNVGQILTDQDVENLRRKDELEEIYLSALRLLNVRSRTVFEIRSRLNQKGYEVSAIEETITRLRKNGLVNDTQYAKDWVEDRAAFHPRSRRLMAWELHQKGVQPDEVNQALDLAGDDEQLALEAARKWAGKHSGLDERQFHTRLMGFLSRRGFHYGTIQPVITELWEEIQEEKRSISLSNPLK